MESQEKETIIRLISFKHSLLCKTVACLLIFTFTITNTAYGDTLRHARNAECHSARRPAERAVGNGQQPPHKGSERPDLAQDGGGSGMEEPDDDGRIKYTKASSSLMTMIDGKACLNVILLESIVKYVARARIVGSARYLANRSGFAPLALMKNAYDESPDIDILLLEQRGEEAEDFMKKLIIELRKYGIKEVRAKRKSARRTVRIGNNEIEINPIILWGEDTAKHAIDEYRKSVDLHFYIIMNDRTIRSYYPEHWLKRYLSVEYHYGNARRHRRNIRRFLACRHRKDMHKLIEDIEANDLPTLGRRISNLADWWKFNMTAKRLDVTLQSEVPPHQGGDVPVAPPFPASGEVSVSVLIERILNNDELALRALQDECTNKPDYPDLILSTLDRDEFRSRKAEFFAKVLLYWAGLGEAERAAFPFKPRWHANPEMLGKDGVTLTPEVYRVIQPYGNPALDFMDDKETVRRILATMETEDYIDRKGRIVIEAMFEKCGIKNTPQEKLLRKIVKVKSERSSIDLDLAPLIRSRNNANEFSAVRQLWEAFIDIAIDIRTYEGDNNVERLSTLSPFYKSLLQIDRILQGPDTPKEARTFYNFQYLRLQKARGLCYLKCDYVDRATSELELGLIGYPEGTTQIARELADLAASPDGRRPTPAGMTVAEACRRVAAALDEKYPGVWDEFEARQEVLRARRKLIHEIINPVNGVSRFLELVKEDLGDAIDPNNLVSEALNSLKDIIKLRWKDNNFLGLLLNWDNRYKTEDLHAALSIPPGTKERTERLVEGIKRGIERIRKVIRNWSQPSMKDRIDINELIKKVLKFIDIFIDIRKIIVLAGNLPQLIGDKTLLEGALLNIFKNAKEAMHGQKDAILSVSTRLADSGHIEIKISDNGPGIPQDVLADIFKEFVTTRRGQGGTGVGLALVKEAVTKLGGTIEVESRHINEHPEDHGTTFILRLPIGRSGQAIRLPVEPPPTQTHSPKPSSGRPARPPLDRQTPPDNAARGSQATASAA